MNGTSINGSTALHYAANRHDNRMVHFLLSREADPDMLNAKSKLGCPVFRSSELVITLLQETGSYHAKT